MARAALAAFEPLGRAEVTLFENLGSGTFDRLGDGGLPVEGDAARVVRAAFIRYLMAGGPGVPDLHEKGLRLEGAWITGTLDLEGCRVGRDLGLVDCHFEAPPILRSAVLDTLFLDGSTLPGLMADRLDARGNVNLRAARVTGPVSLEGAQIGGDLVGDGATLDYAGERALSADRMSVRGGVLLRGATVTGGLAFPGARIGSDLDLVGSRIDRPDGLAVDADGATITGDVALRLVQVTGGVNMVTARVGGDVDLSGGRFTHPGERAVNLARSSVTGAFFLREGAVIEGALSLNGATIGALVDDPASWPAPGELLLNRCLYDAFLAAPVGAGLRLKWLALQEPSRWGEDFWPQPYEQLGRVLMQMGHTEDGRRVLVAKERLVRAARRARARSPLWRAMLWVQDTAVGVTTGYGRRPLLALIWLALLWVMGAVTYTVLEAEEAIRPNVMVILRSPEWVMCAVPQGETLFMASLGITRDGLALPDESQLACFLQRPEAAAFPKHNPLMMSADAILPGLETGQRDYWSPDTRFAIGYAGRWFMYFQTIAGWVLSLLAVAGFSGIVKTD